MQGTQDLEYAVSVSSLPRNWEKPTPNEIIDAYEAGKNEQERVNAAFLRKNIEEACETSEALFNQLNSSVKMKCTDLHLRVTGISQFEALLLVDLKDYLSDKRKEAQAKARNLTEKTDSSTFHIEFTFLPIKEPKKASTDTIAADGYFLTYKPHVKKTPARKAQ